MWSSSMALWLRSLGRRIGLNRWVGKTLRIRGREDRFAAAMIHNIREGDTVWDVGANIGAYTSEYLTRVGNRGRVVAFEPVPACFEQLVAKFGSIENAVLKNIALSDSDGMVQMQLQDDPLSTTARIRTSREGAGAGRYVEVVASRGDSLVAREPDLFPGVIKIDVEGHEGAVVNGLRQLLPHPRLRCIGIEVHFTVLEQQDEMHVPALLQRVLQEHSFHTRWTDSSHVLACR